MISQLESNKIDQDTIMTFIPDAVKEEELIDNLNFIAGNEGLSVVNLSVAAAPVVQEEAATDISGNPVVEGVVVDGSDPTAPIENTVVKAKGYEVELSVVGGYEKIKNTLDKIYKLKRYNSVKSLTIGANEEEGSEDGKAKAPSGDDLKADMVLNFNMLRKYSGTVSMNNPIFSQSSFDMKVAADVRNKKSVDILKMNIDQAGRANPFTP
jgi:hypothetical protein